LSAPTNGSETFLHCAKALKRSNLWHPSRHADRAEFPGIARIILEQTSALGAAPNDAAMAEGDAFVEDDY
jgi:uncharacterized protein